MEGNLAIVQCGRGSWERHGGTPRGLYLLISSASSVPARARCCYCCCCYCLRCNDENNYIYLLLMLPHRVPFAYSPFSPFHSALLSHPLAPSSYLRRTNGRTSERAKQRAEAPTGFGESRQRNLPGDDDDDNDGTPL